jgi:hypothetical protein
MVRYQEYARLCIWLSLQADAGLRAMLLRLARTWIRAQLREQRKIAPKLGSVARSSAETYKELSRKERRSVFDRKLTHRRCLS